MLHLKKYVQGLMTSANMALKYTRGVQTPDSDFGAWRRAIDDTEARTDRLGFFGCWREIELVTTRSGGVVGPSAAAVLKARW